MSDDLEWRKRVETRILAIEAKLGGVAAALGGASATSAGGGTAPASDLDSQYGDEEIKSKVPRWEGRQFKGHVMSECDVGFLDAYADFRDWAATKADEKGEKAANGTPISKYDRRSAARARGWAARLRSGWKPPERPKPGSWLTDEPKPEGDSSSRWR